MKTTLDCPLYPLRPVEAILRTKYLCPIRNMTTGTMLAKTTPAIKVATFGTRSAPLLRVTCRPCCSVYKLGDEVKTSGLSRLNHSARKVKIKTVVAAGAASGSITDQKTR